MADLYDDDRHYQPPPRDAKPSDKMAWINAKKEKARLYYLANKSRLREKYLARKEAISEKGKVYYREHREEILQRNSEYHLANNEKIKAQRLTVKDHRNEKWRGRYHSNPEPRKTKLRERYKDNMSGRKDWYLKKKYGITVAERDELFLRQGNCCAICKTKSAAAWDIDHCHVSGQVRGILCHPCNVMLGMAKDDTSVLISGVAYLNSFNISSKRKAA